MGCIPLLHKQGSSFNCLATYNQFHWGSSNQSLNCIYPWDFFHDSIPASLATLTRSNPSNTNSVTFLFGALIFLSFAIALAAYHTKSIVSLSSIILSISNWYVINLIQLWYHHSFRVFISTFEPIYFD